MRLLNSNNPCGYAMLPTGLILAIAEINPDNKQLNLFLAADDQNRLIPELQSENLLLFSRHSLHPHIGSKDTVSFQLHTDEPRCINVRKISHTIKIQQPPGFNYCDIDETRVLKKIACEYLDLIGLYFYNKRVAQQQEVGEQHIATIYM